VKGQRRVGRGRREANADVPDTLADGTGMLFLHEARAAGYWMKNASLDILYFDSDRRLARSRGVPGDRARPQYRPRPVRARTQRWPGLGPGRGGRRRDVQPRIAGTVS
jgi:hypothetical protein